MPGRRSLRAIAGALLVTVLSAFVPAAVAADPVRTLTGDECVPWERIECHENSLVKFPQEIFLPETQHRAQSAHGKGIVEAFGGNPAPHSRFFLLHYAAGWDRATQPVPVLLVHGAASNATLSWAGTWFDGTSKGLMQHLAERGYAVFAVTFPCGQGDLYYMTEHVARAVEIVRERTKAARVDLIGHSLGGIAARMYVTGMCLHGGPNRVDVRRVLFLGTPHRGLDLAFRHPIAYQRFGSYGMPAPWTFYKLEGDITARSIYGGAYRAQLQLLADLTDLHRLSEAEMDWYTTWHGGDGYVSRSKGIKEAIKLGGDHMAKLRARRFPADVDVYVLAGRKSLMKYVNKAGQVLEEVGEYDGPCDGIVFVKSAADEEGLKAAGARLRGVEVLEVNHVELLYLEAAKSWVEGRLAAEAAPGKKRASRGGPGALPSSAPASERMFVHIEASVKES